MEPLARATSRISLLVAFDAAVWRWTIAEPHGRGGLRAGSTPPWPTRRPAPSCRSRRSISRPGGRSAAAASCRSSRNIAGSRSAGPGSATRVPAHRRQPRGQAAPADPRVRDARRQPRRVQDPRPERAVAHGPARASARRSRASCATTRSCPTGRSATRPTSASSPPSGRRSRPGSRRAARRGGAVTDPDSDLPRPADPDRRLPHRRRAVPHRDRRRAGPRRARRSWSGGAGRASTRRRPPVAGQRAARPRRHVRRLRHATRTTTAPTSASCSSTTRATRRPGPRHDRAGHVGGRDRPRRVHPGREQSRRSRSTCPAAGWRARRGSTRTGRVEAVRFRNVPVVRARARRDRRGRGSGCVTLDVAFGGAFYGVARVASSDFD